MSIKYKNILEKILEDTSRYSSFNIGKQFQGSVYVAPKGRATSQQIEDAKKKISSGTASTTTGFGDVNKAYATSALRKGLSTLPVKPKNLPNNGSTGNSTLAANPSNRTGALAALRTGLSKTNPNMKNFGGKKNNTSQSDGINSPIVRGGSSNNFTGKSSNDRLSPPKTTNNMTGFGGKKGNTTQAGGKSPTAPKPKTSNNMTNFGGKKQGAGPSMNNPPTPKLRPSNNNNPPNPRPRPNKSTTSNTPATPANGTTFKDAFAAARKSGLQTFNWTDPRTGKSGLYTTKLRGQK